MKQGNELSSQDEEGKTELFLSLSGHLVCLSTADGYVGNFLSCIKGVKDLSRLKREGGIFLETPQQKRAPSRTEG